MRGPRALGHQGWTLVSPPPRGLRPTLERHSSSRQNRSMLRAGALCLLSKMNPTLAKLGFNRAGCALSPHRIPLSPPSPCNPRPRITRIPLMRSSAPAGGCRGWSDGPDALGQGLLDLHRSQLMRDTRQGSLKDWVSRALFRPQGRNASPNPIAVVTRCLQLSDCLVLRTPPTTLPHSSPPTCTLESGWKQEVEDAF